MPEESDSRSATLILETPRLILRTWTLEDVPAAGLFYGDPEVMRFLGGKALATPEEVREKVAKRIAHQQKHGFSLWAVIEKATGRLIGACGLTHLEDGPEVEVGYHFARDVWGQGFATEAASACMRLGFERLGLARIVGVVDPANLTSKRVLEKIGLVFERPGHHYNHDVLRYVAERSEYVPRAT